MLPHNKHVRGDSDSSDSLIKAAKRLGAEVARLRFQTPVAYVYNPLSYAWELHKSYLRTYGKACKRVIFLGMNPGPFGMVQTGIPFGEVAAVRTWLGLEGTLGRPEVQHPKRPILGFQCTRSEVSGQRLWGLFADRFTKADRFFRDHIVMNYCPLAFLEATGRNRTPDKLAPAEKARLFELCDGHLRSIVAALQPEWVIGIGDFASRRAELVLHDHKIKIGRILHPSPASPAANRNWSNVAARQLEQLGVWKKGD